MDPSRVESVLLFSLFIRISIREYRKGSQRIRDAAVLPVYGYDRRMISNMLRIMSATVLGLPDYISGDIILASLPVSLYMIVSFLMLSSVTSLQLARVS